MGLDAYGLKFDLENPYLNGLPRTLGYQFDLENDFWKKGLPSNFRQKSRISIRLNGLICYNRLYKREYRG